MRVFLHIARYVHFYGRRKDERVKRWKGEKMKGWERWNCEKVEKWEAEKKDVGQPSLIQVRSLVCNHGACFIVWCPQTSKVGKRILQKVPVITLPSRRVNLRFLCLMHPRGNFARRQDWPINEVSLLIIPLLFSLSGSFGASLFLANSAKSTTFSLHFFLAFVLRFVCSYMSFLGKIDGFY